MCVNKDKIILDLCGGTGAWSRPYKENGYDVRIITLPENDIFLWDEYKIFIKRIYGILAAPDCSHFSFARQRAKKPRNFREAMRLVDRCLQIIRDIVIDGNPKFWALENPLGYLRKIIGKPFYTFEAWEFGDPHKKKTDLWGYFNLPKKNPVVLNLVDPNFINKTMWQKVKIPESYIIPKGMCKKKIKRSITPPGFAMAFYVANK
jgi:site-specific DNA-cytosine methylase